MADPEQVSTSVNALLEEYKALRAEILMRLDLQHKNMNLLLALVSAITGFLVKFANDHGVSGSGATLVHSEIVILVPLAALSINVFLWRHSDHDVAIIDAASYVERRLKKAVVTSLGSGPYLGYEDFLSKRRRERGRQATRLVSLGNENVTMFFLLAIFLAAGWLIRLSNSSHAANAHEVFDVLLYLASALAIFSLAISILVGGAYKRISPEDARAKSKTAKSTEASSPGDQTAEGTDALALTDPQVPAPPDPLTKDAAYPGESEP
ncbi:MAG TPA: hypothetical protein VFG42_11330 [Baekduia sp.]|uniref:hypothetical protein n=1 Tax=Baekduia sp. TaxID=2600305 RepID=UPI002D77E018|nr:hypothetical protein [Baekduia sp.]HET6507369.1 hypothetical protein [Baekduia sp.]